MQLALYSVTELLLQVSAVIAYNVMSLRFPTEQFKYVRSKHSIKSASRRINDYGDSMHRKFKLRSLIKQIRFTLLKTVDLRVDACFVSISPLAVTLN
jgi:hypothetical protein